MFRAQMAARKKPGEDMQFSLAAGSAFSGWRMGAGALFLLGVACSSHAQFGGGQRQRGAQAQMGGPASQRPQTRWEQVSRRLYDLRVQLLITKEQGPAWENFRGRFLDMATSGSPDQRVVDEQTAKDAFDQLLGDAQRRSNVLATLDATAQVLLSQFSPEQLQAADKALPPLLAEFGGNR
ncbi:hypothetical protein DT070_17435 [Polaromonas sp. SP1]|nr:hypothetical protein DT070_17435 [Polaromonas sp. SP1]